MEVKKLSLKKNMIYNSLGSIFYLGCQWLITVLVVRLASYSDAGMLSLAMSISNIFFTVATFGIRTFQVSDYNNKYTEKLYVKTRFFTCTVAMVFCIMFALVNVEYTKTQILVIVLYMFYKIIEAFIDVLAGIQQKKERMDYICISFVLRGVLSLSAFVSIILITGSLLYAIIGMIILTAMILVFYDLRICYKIADLKTVKNDTGVRDVMSECWTLMLNTMFLSALVAIPRYFLEAIYDNEMLGIYASVATPTVIVQTACNLIYNPLISKLTHNYTIKNKKEYIAIIKKCVIAVTAFFLLSVLIAAIWGNWGMKLLFGKEIADYVYLLIPILFTTFFIALIYFFGMLLTIMRKLKTLVTVNGISALIILLISPLLIKKFALDGINYTLYIGCGIDLSLLIYMVTRESKKYFRSIESSQ